MKAAPFRYAVPVSLDEAVEILASEDESKVLAGGQSLVPLLNMRLARPDILVDIQGIAGLDQIVERNGSVELGAMVRQRDAELSAVVARACPLLAEALRLVSHPQIRNRGTVCGSLAHADPAAELGAVALVLEALIRTFGKDGGRTIPVGEFFRSHYTTALTADEVLTAVEFPRQPDGAGSACMELVRRPGDFPLCGAAAQIVLDDGGKVVDARIGLFGVASTAIRAREAETGMIGQTPDEEAISTSARRAVESLSPPSDIHASSEFRKRLAATTVARTLGEAVRRAQA